MNDELRAFLAETRGLDKIEESSNPFWVKRKTGLRKNPPPVDDYWRKVDLARQLKARANGRRRNKVKVTLAGLRQESD